MTIRAPEVFGMTWTPAHDPSILRTDYTGEAATAMHLLAAPAGMTVEYVEDAKVEAAAYSVSGGGTAIALRPALANQAELDRWSEAIIPRMQEWKASQAKRNFDMCGAAHRAQVKTAKAEAQELLDRWGTFVANSKGVREILAMEYPMPQQLKKLQKAIQATKAKATAFLIEHKDRAVNGVDWSDDDVVRAITILTRADADHSEFANDEGWNRRHSSLGHWCYGMLQTDRALAIKVGRGIVGAYPAQVGPLKLR